MKIPKDFETNDIFVVLILKPQKSYIMSHG